MRHGLRVFLLLLFCPAFALAQVTRLEITSREPAAGGRIFGEVGAYETIRGRVHGELDPADRHNRIIQDLALAPRNARGRVEYVATFSMMKPVDSKRASGVLIYTVVNRGNGAPAAGPEGHISLVSGWQGDVTPTDVNQTIQVPVARNSDGSDITGPVLARFWDLPAGTTTATVRLGSLGTGYYPPAALETSQATLTFHTSETVTGQIGGAATVPPSDWAFADCRTTPFPGTPDRTRVCLRGGFDPAKIYELVYTAKDPKVLGIGLAATRDIVSFFRHRAGDDAGTPNPVAQVVRHAIAVGTSQSGNFLKTAIHLGFNEDLSGRIVWDGVFPYIAGRQTPLNFRFATPGGAATLYEPGSEPVVWWGRYADARRGRPVASLLDRCTASGTCPKVIEAFGSTEFWGLRMSPGLVGTDGVADIALPDNVRRYYMPGTTHGGGRGGFEREQPTNARCALPTNPNPMSDTMRALTAALVAWVAKGTEPPPSRYPTLAERQLVAATRDATGFPNIHGVRFPENLVNAALDYDFGPGFLYSDMSGAIARQPPAIRGVLPALVPRVDADGNEIGGVASPLHQAPLGTYLGWNIQAAGFFAGQLCGFEGGYVPFAATRAERLQTSDPRPSLEERYGTREGYACVVSRAVTKLVRDRYLLAEDGERIQSAAANTTALPLAASAEAGARQTGEALCRAGNEFVAQSASTSDRCAVDFNEKAGIERTTVRGARLVSDGTPHCRIEASVTTAADSVVNFEVWIPQEWNGKLVATGNGGYSNAINVRDMGHALSQRYAAVGGDTGHQTPTPDDLLWGVDHPERIIDWGTRSIHAITAPAKRIVERVRGSSPSRAYFYGCSTGGHQGYAEIQRYPEDFDGVIAGAPGNNRVRLNVAFLWQFMSNHERGDNATAIIPASKLPLITSAVIAACDANDGVKDGVVDDPRSCRFDPATIECKADQAECLTASQVAALRKMYKGATNPRTGEQIYPGWPAGSEAPIVSPQGGPLSGWQQYWGTTEPTRAAFWRHWIFRDPKWDWWSFDFDRHVALADERVGKMVDQVNPDLAAFKARGGKAIVYQGWQDPVTSALGTIAYYEQVRSRQGSQEETDRFFRLFMVPGMGHCAGGSGATNFGNQNAPSPVVDADHDLLSALDAWVEKGTAPSRIVASRVVNGTTTRTRPLCSYPQKAVYTGTGSTDDAASFVCR